MDEIIDSDTHRRRIYTYVRRASVDIRPHTSTGHRQHSPTPAANSVSGSRRAPWWSTAGRSDPTPCTGCKLQQQTTSMFAHPEFRNGDSD